MDIVINPMWKKVFGIKVMCDDNDHNKGTKVSETETKLYITFGIQMILKENGCFIY